MKVIIQSFSEKVNSPQTLAEEKFRNHKLMTNDIVLKLSRNAYSKESAQVKECGSYLVFSHQKHLKSGETRDKLKRADFCKFRFCPMCAWRRNINIGRELLGALGKIEEERGELGYLFLTLTVKNPDIEDLKSAVAEMNKSFKRMSETKAFQSAVIGHFKALEILGDNTKEGEAHPHFHILVLVNKSYFVSRDYLSQAKWIEMWKKAIRADYVPVVDIRKIKPKKNTTLTAIQSAVYEVAKYSVKHTELTSRSDKDFCLILNQTKGMRFFSTGGILKEKINLLKCDEELINLNEQKEAEWHEIEELLYRWKNGDYFLSKGE